MSTALATHPHAQSKYQVRFDWGVDGAALVADGASVVVWVDALAGDDGRIEALAALVPDSALILAGGVTDAALVAQRVLDEQVLRGDRAFVAVVAAGAPRGGTLRFCVEDLLGAGAVIDALAAVGIDYSSPEAAAACAAFGGLRGAVTHLATASSSAQELIADGVSAAEIRAGNAVGSAQTVRVLR